MNKQNSFHYSLSMLLLTFLRFEHHNAFTTIVLTQKVTAHRVAKSDALQATSLYAFTGCRRCKASGAQTYYCARQ